MIIIITTTVSRSAKNNNDDNIHKRRSFIRKKHFEQSENIERNEFQIRRIILYDSPNSENMIAYYLRSLNPTRLPLPVII